jgi:low affinity Fe/Cu permease
MPTAASFSKFSRAIADFSGRSTAFIMACSLVVLWLITGPIFAFSDTWQLVINTGTTIVTFLMVFLIQNTQNRDSSAIHIKLDELIRAQHGAQNTLLDLEELTQEQLDEIKLKYGKLAQMARTERSDFT